MQSNLIVNNNFKECPYCNHLIEKNENNDDNIICKKCKKSFSFEKEGHEIKYQKCPKCKCICKEPYGDPSTLCFNCNT